jgi:glycosyltransferase involved in cell wall biosynthesis
MPLPGDPTQKLITPNVPRLWKQFVRFRPNVVVTVTPGPFGLLGLFLARRFQSGFLTAFHTHFEELVRLYYDPMSERVARNYLVTVNRILCKRSDAVLVNNPELTKAVEALGARNVEVIGTPFPISFLSEPLCPPPETFHQVLFAGRLAPEKNLPLVIEAARKVPRLQFVLAGDGPLRDQLQQQAQGLRNVTFTGWISRQELRRKIDESNLLLLPSHNETFGTVALEAMARGRPALVAQAAGIHQWETLRPGLFTLNTGQCAAEVLTKLQQHPPRFWQQKAHAARDAAASLNSQTIRHWLEFLSRNARPWTRNTPQDER